VHFGIRNNCFGLAKGAAYSGLLSLFPVLTTVAAILVQTMPVAISKSLSTLVFEVVPPGTEEVVLYNFHRTRPAPHLAPHPRDASGASGRLPAS